MLTSKQKMKIVKEVQTHEKDTGSAKVQIGILTKRVEELAGHLKKHPQDTHSRRGLLKMVSKRRKLEKYESRRAKNKEQSREQSKK